MRLKVCLTLLALLTASPVLAVPILSIEPSVTTVSAGSVFAVDVDITDAVDVYAFQFDLGFDQTALSVESVSEGSFLSTGGATFFIPGSIDNSAGTISSTSDSLLTAISGVSGNGTLVTVNFRALVPSTSTLSLFNFIVLDSQLSGIVASVEAGSVIVTDSTSVPEPSVLTLVGIALAYSWRRRGIKKV